MAGAKQLGYGEAHGSFQRMTIRPTPGRKKALRKGWPNPVARFIVVNILVTIQGWQRTNDRLRRTLSQAQ
jgi:hypothetical protein